MRKQKQYPPQPGDPIEDSEYRWLDWQLLDPVRPERSDDRVWVNREDLEEDVEPE